MQQFSVCPKNYFLQQSIGKVKSGRGIKGSETDCLNMVIHILQFQKAYHVCPFHACM